jgi:hypothetical protein
MTGPIWAIAAGLHAAGTELGQAMVVAAALHEPPTVSGPTGR